MIKIKFTLFVYLHRNNNGVMVRVRWDNKREEVVFSTGCVADPTKWNNQCAKTNTTHKVGKHSFTSQQINNEINKVKTAVEQAFASFELQGHYPNKLELKNEVSKLLGKEDSTAIKNNVKEKNSLENLYQRFLSEREEEKLWDKKSRDKYNQVIKRVMYCDKNITIEKIDKQFMIKFRNWHIDNKYKNSTTGKSFTCLRSFLRWAKQEGYKVNDSAINYRENIIVRKKKVLFLKFEELLAFYNYEFSKKESHLQRARDMFCFMAFTSLRYSDISKLKVTDVHEDHIELYTEKTDKMLSIPLVSYAKKIVEQYRGNGKNGLLFPKVKNNRLNKYIRKAAQKVNLNRQFVQVSYIGNERYEKVDQICDILSCHAARRTFVCISLHLDIPLSVVMKCTGHADYSAMRPYIEVADEKTAHELAKWEHQSKKTEIDKLLKKVGEDKLDEVLKLLRA